MNLEIYNMTDYDLSLIKDILIDDFDDFGHMMSCKKNLIILTQNIL